MEYIKIRPTKFLYYQFKQSYENLLLKYNLIQRYSLSSQDILDNNYIVYEIGNNYKLQLYKLPPKTWRLFKIKFNLYISKETYLFLLNNYIYELNNNLYIFQNLTKKLNNKLQLILHNICNTKIIEYVISYINNDKIDTQQFLNLYHVVSKHTEWFFKISKNINYENEINLNMVQQGLIQNINYIDENCLNSWLNKDWWIFRGWSENDAINFISNIQKKNSKKYLEKYYKDPQKYKIKFNTNINYWLNKGYNYEEAKKKLSERQNTFSLKKCIEIYGNEKGLEIFNKRQEKWQNTLLSKENYMEIVYKRTAHNICASKISQELFISIHNNLKKQNINIEKIYYKANNHEWGFGIKNRGGVLYDFVIPSLKYAIEFNGERFHPNKDKLSDFEWKNWTNPWNKSADYIYKRDKEKNDALINKGFILDIIWETEYKNNKEYIINLYTQKIIKLYEESKIYKS